MELKEVIFHFYKICDTLLVWLLMKKIVIFGGGSGLSQLLKGIKLFPVEITAVVSVADNGGSTGLLRRELKIPAVGDITKVMLSMADTNQDVIDWIIDLLNRKV